MNLIRMVKAHEGFEPLPYECSAGHQTIGYGRNLEANPLTKDEATFLLENDIEKALQDCSQGIDNWHLIDDVRQSVLIDMCINLGWGGLYKFRRTLNFIEVCDYESAAIEMLNSKWAKQVGRRSERLSEMMETGEWPDDI